MIDIPFVMTGKEMKMQKVLKEKSMEKDGLNTRQLSNEEK